ncbi:MAG TPA: chorismate lyase [Rhodocyclaceae bacterium]|jgi:chorismate--pyruvate lyase|nr:chorismate lyase [Rhodocyclaceae bacterium]
MSLNRINSRSPDAGGWLPHIPKSLPAVLQAWLGETGSLTRRVQSICSSAQPFSLRLLAHDFSLPHRDEVTLLQTHQRVRSREILLQRGSVPLVFAHSVVARRDLRGAWTSMDGVGGRSLGSVLFADHRVVRGALHFKRLDARHPLFQKALPWCGVAPKELWARRAVFSRYGKPLAVTEVFLPSILSL